MSTSFRIQWARLLCGGLLLRCKVFLAGMLCLPAMLTASDSLSEVPYPDTGFMTTVAGEVIHVQSRVQELPGAWFFLVNCIMFLLLVVKYTMFRSFTRRSWDAWVNDNIFFQLTREKSPVNIWVATVEGVLKVWMVASMVMLAAGLLKPGFKISLQVMAITCGSVAVFFLLKYLAAYGVSILTDRQELFQAATLNSMVIASNAAWVVVPLIFVVLYLPAPFSRYGSWLVLAIAVLIILVLLKRVFGIILRMKDLFNLQFFLYLCAFEILPYLILVRVLESNVVE